MKNLKKISALVLLVCAICVGFIVTSLAEDEYTGTMDDLNALVLALDGAANPLAAYEAVADYLPTVDPASEGYADAVATVNTKAIALAKTYLSEMAAETVESTANNQVAVNRFNAFVKLGLCDAESDEYKQMMTDAEARIALQEEAKAAKRQALLDQSLMSDYDLKTILTGSMTDGANPFMTKDEKSTGKVTVKDGILQISTRPVGAGEEQTSAYVQQSGFAALSGEGIVIEFDFASLGDTTTRFHLEGGGHTSLADGSRVYPSLMQISADGNVAAGNRASGDANRVYLKNAIVKGEWLHFSIVYDPVDFTFSLYCEYELLGTYTAKVDGKHTFNLNIARFATDTNPDGGIHGFDNVQIYQGTTLRDLGMFERMNDEEKFVYYANYYTNDAIDDTIGRYTALKNINTMMEKYIDENGAFKPFAQGSISDEEYAAILAEVEAAVNLVQNYDSAEFMESLKISNRDTFIKYVEDAVSIERVLTSTNIDDRVKAASSIEAFLLSIDGNIDNGEGYAAAVEAYNRFVTESHVDKNILEFNKYMDIYSKVDTLNSLRKYYNFAQTLFEDANYPIDPSLADMPGFEAFKTAYELYANATARIEAVERDQNSKKVVSCYGLIEDIAKDEWVNNYDYMNGYVVMIREVKASGYYNYDYPGFADTLEKFAEMDEFFYALLQQEHINELTVRLDFVKNNDAYIEKMGTLSYIGRYLESNDIDRSIPEIQTLIANYETALEELTFREQDYEAVLTQNAAYFVALVEKMRISNDFNEKRELHAMATEFYFALDARYEGAAEAIIVYDEHTLYFENGEIASKLFLDAVVVLRAATTEEEKYAALVDCYTYSLDAVDTYTGVAEAMAFYQAEYDAYTNAANSTIEVIESMGVTVASVRSNCGVNAIIAVIIKKIFG